MNDVSFPKNKLTGKYLQYCKLFSSHDLKSSQKLNFFDYLCEREPVIYFFKRNHAFINDSDTLYHLGTLGLIGTIKKAKHKKFFQEQVRKRLGSRHK